VRRGARRAALGLALAALAAGAGAAAPPPPQPTPAVPTVRVGAARRGGSVAAVSPPTWPRADRRLLHRVLAEGGVQRVEPEPGWREYWVDVGRAFGRWLSGLLGRQIAAMSGAGAVVAYAVLVLAGVLVAAAVVLAVRLASRRRRPGGQGREGGQAEAAVPSRAISPPDLQGWRAEVERRIVANDVPGALHALWWWLATALAAGEVDLSWTTLDLLRRAGRRDLGSLGLVLDRLRFGPAASTAAQVRRLADDMAEALA
jgi:hypothetical protein